MPRNTFVSWPRPWESRVFLLLSACSTGDSGDTAASRLHTQHRHSDHDAGHAHPGQRQPGLRHPERRHSEQRRTEQRRTGQRRTGQRRRPTGGTDVTHRLLDGRLRGDHRRGQPDRSPAQLQDRRRGCSRRQHQLQHVPHPELRLARHPRRHRVVADGCCCSTTAGSSAPASNATPHIRPSPRPPTPPSTSTTAIYTTATSAPTRPAAVDVWFEWTGSGVTMHGTLPYLVTYGKC